MSQGRLSIQERAKIASRYEVWQSIVEVQRWWRNINGPHAVLDPKTIKNCHSKLITTGSVADSKRTGRPSTSRSEENIQIVREMFTRSPEKTTRQAARESGLTWHTVMTALKSLSFRPWKPHYCQEITPEDCDRRMEYGEIMLGWHGDWPELFDNIVWSDEAIFHVGGFVNRHNCHYWAEFDPKVTAEKMQNRSKVTVWCGMTSSQVIGPFLFRETMNGERYLNMLENRVWPALSTFDNIENMVFMQDGAPPHFASNVRQWLDNRFPGRWLGRRGPHEWPARSPDLTPCDFFLWGWAKDEVYRSKPRTLDELEVRIQQVLTNVPQHFLQKSITDIPRRLQKLVETAGAYIEF